MDDGGGEQEGGHDRRELGCRVGWAWQDWHRFLDSSILLQPHARTLRPHVSIHRIEV
jgi:hypothetical protein